MIADKGYDADLFIEVIESGEAIAVIPPRKSSASTTMEAIKRHAIKRHASAILIMAK